MVIVYVLSRVIYLICTSHLLLIKIYSGRNAVDTCMCVFCFVTSYRNGFSQPILLSKPVLLYFSWLIHQEAFNSATVVGVGAASIALILSFIGCRPSASMWYPENGTDWAIKVHLRCFTHKPASESFQYHL